MLPTLLSAIDPRLLATYCQVAGDASDFGCLPLSAQVALPGRAFSAIHGPTQ
jgi:hypothetical protein